MEDTFGLSQTQPISLMIEGGQTPSGAVRVSGAKNSALKLMAAGLLTDDKIHLDNFPTLLVDTQQKARFISSIGASIEFNHASETMEIQANGVHNQLLPNYDFPFRTTYLLAAGQLLRHGIARIPYPGGCKIGERKYDLHILVWEKMGCTVTERENHIEIRCDNLRPAEINFPISTVGGTENALLMAAITPGTTTIRNAYVTPEIYDLVGMLSSMGASIQLFGNSQILVNGSPTLRGTSYRVMPDRIEALTWIVYGILSKGRIIVENTPFSDMEVPLIHLRDAGIDLFRNSRHAYVDNSYLHQGSIQPFELACGTHPGVISDMQPFFVLLGLMAQGRSKVFDYRYPTRMAYLEQLQKFCKGAITWKSGEITLNGPVKLEGAEVMSTDLRGSMVLILAGLLAEGKTTVERADLALRGYNNLTAKLKNIGITAVSL